MPEITTSDLARFARQSNVELRVTPNQENVEQVQTRGGTLFGRLGRSLKILFGREDRTQKNQEYMSAKIEVRNALKRTYGDEIGERAFRAGIGEMRNGHHFTSGGDPITGRHIQKMIKVAEREVAQLDGVRDFGRNGFRDQTGRAMTGQATAFWMNKMALGQGSPTLDDVGEMQQIEQSGSGRFKVGDLHYGLRGEPVPGERGQMAPGLTVTSSVGEDLIRDIDTKFQQEPNRAHGFWTLDLELSRGGPALGRSRQHVIGIFVDRNDPGTIHVFDANRREVSIPRDQFAGWLSAHIKDVYGTVSVMSLYRAEEKRIGIFERKDDRWTCNEICVLSQDSLDRCRTNATRRMQGGVEGGVDGSPPMYQNFWKDVDRSRVTIGRLDGEPPLQITRETPERLMPLVDNDLQALKSLSCLLDQSMPNALNDTATTSFKVQDEPCVPEGQTGRSRIDVSIMRNGDNLEISYTTEKRLLGFMVYDGDGFVRHGTSPWTDRVKAQTTIRVSLDELRQAGEEGRVPNFEFLEPPNARLQVENYSGVVNPELNVEVPRIHRLENAISSGEGLPGRWDQFNLAMKSRIGGQPVVRFTENGIPIAECLYDHAQSLTLKIGDGQPQTIPDEERKQVHERFLGVVDGDAFRVSQLSKLIDQTLVDDMCEELGYSIGASPKEIDDCLAGGHQFSLQTIMVDDQPVVEITMSQKLDTQNLLTPPYDLPNPEVYGSMTIRVPFSELDNGHPENFTVVSKPHFEIRQEPELINIDDNV